jgi:hypothetical protein
VFGDNGSFSRQMGDYKNSFLIQPKSQHSQFSPNSYNHWVMRVFSQKRVKKENRVKPTVGYKTRSSSCHNDFKE